jgi:hypothetical protein
MIGEIAGTASMLAAHKATGGDMTKQTEQQPPESQPTTPPKAKSKTFLERLYVERQELGERIDSLTAFVQDPTSLFPEIEQEERERLQGQLTAMSHYFMLLTARIGYYQNKQGRG